MFLSMGATGNGHIDLYCGYLCEVAQLVVAPLFKGGCCRFDSCPRNWAGSLIGKAVVCEAALYGGEILLER